MLHYPMAYTSTFLLSYSFHFSFVCTYCNVLFFPLLWFVTFSHVLDYVSLLCHWFLIHLYFKMDCGLCFRWTVPPFLNFLSMWIGFVYDLIITAFFYLSTYSFKKIIIFSFYIENGWIITFFYIFPVIYCYFYIRSSHSICKNLSLSKTLLQKFPDQPIICLRFLILSLRMSRPFYDQ